MTLILSYQYSEFGFQSNKCSIDDDYEEPYSSFLTKISLFLFSTFDFSNVIFIIVESDEKNY